MYRNFKFKGDGNMHLLDSPFLIHVLIDRFLLSTLDEI
jgi:hypothetical protein